MPAHSKRHLWHSSASYEFQRAFVTHSTPSVAPSCPPERPPPRHAVIGASVSELEPDLVLCGEGSQQNHQVSASMSRLLESVSLDDIVAFVMMNPSIAVQCADSVFELLKETMERNFEAKYEASKMQQQTAK